MSRLLTRDDLDQIEALIDLYGLTGFLDAAETVCYEKANHVQTNWQDDRLASKWNAAAKRFAKFTEWARHTGPA